MKKAIVDVNTGEVLNVILIEQKAIDKGWKPPAGTELKDAESASIGYIWDGKTYVKPEPKLEPEPVVTLEARLAALEAEVIALKSVKE